MPGPRTEVLGFDAHPAAVGGATPPPAATTGSAPARAMVAGGAATAADGERPPLSLLISGVVLIVIGAVGFTLALVHRPARHR
ncbi:hypothetical protein [Kitasatospora sp. NPDC004272]